ncbi:hypothetical protein GCM10023201_52040 [Actinomycetospora corticicola]|uniref:Uncharacterized protein n=1 Tax=Actinomycetospora corticicola TaxID=663602 RepID=A0A7Y9DXT8_9PSEU|nr:hypothetical protein [Actinomycetospora corticicola]NYD37533.1 hypothetical protein [Actinomycetospora corticicola]
MHLHLRTLAVFAALLLGSLVVGWGIAASLRPTLWSRREVRWCVGWAPDPVGRTFGAAVAVFGAGIVVSGVACALIPLGVAIPPLARLVELIGLGIVVLGGVALLVTHPAPIPETGGHGLAIPRASAIGGTAVPSPVGSSGHTEAAPAALSPEPGRHDAMTR